MASLDSGHYEAVARHVSGNEEQRPEAAEGGQGRRHVLRMAGVAAAMAAGVGAHVPPAQASKTVSGGRLAGA